MRHGAVSVAIWSGLIKLASRRRHLCEDLKEREGVHQGDSGGQGPTRQWQGRTTPESRCGRNREGREWWR